MNHLIFLMKLHIFKKVFFYLLYFSISNHILCFLFICFDLFLNSEFPRSLVNLAVSSYSGWNSKKFYVCELGLFFAVR